MNTSKTLATCLATSTLLFLGCLGTSDVGDPCTLEAKPGDDILTGEVVIETGSAQCESAVCLYYNEETFCTTRCESDGDCVHHDGEEGLCEAHIVVGEPRVLGTYCVPAYASTMP